MQCVNGLLSAISAAALLSATGASAEFPGVAALANMCVTCHSRDEELPSSIPSLTPLDEETMRAFLIGFRTGDIEATVMDRIANALTDAEIEALARHFGDTTEQEQRRRGLK